jgi:hypothetical protein
MNDEFTELKLSEEAKRERNWDPAERWRVIQATIAWAEQQQTVRRNTPAACLAHQNRLLASLASAAQATPPNSAAGAAQTTHKSPE